MASSMRLVNGHPCPAHLGPNGYGYATPSLLNLKNLLLCSNTLVDDYRRPCAVTPEDEFLLPVLCFNTTEMPAGSDGARGCLLERSSWYFRKTQ